MEILPRTCGRIRAWFRENIQPAIGIRCQGSCSIGGSQNSELVGLGKQPWGPYRSRLGSFLRRGWEIPSIHSFPVRADIHGTSATRLMRLPFILKVASQIIGVARPYSMDSGPTPLAVTVLLRAYVNNPPPCSPLSPSHPPH